MKKRKETYLSRAEVEERILGAMREYFLRFTDAVAKKYQHQINASVKWYVRSLPRHIASSEADDLASEARIAFVESLKTWDPRKGDLWPYVSIRIKGSMQDYLRKRGTDPITGLYEWVTQAAYVYLAFNKEAIHHQTIDESVEVESAMGGLTDTEKKVLDEHFKKDRTFKEIGKEIKLSESQVSRICKAATKKVKKALAPKKTPRKKVS